MLWSVCLILAAVGGASIYADHRVVFPEEARNGARIVSGWEAEPGQFPFQLSIRMVNPTGGVVSCGASIIHSNWALTAAHCPASRVTIVVRAGAVSLTRPVYIFETLDYWNHPLYNENLPGVVQPNDIGVIRFNRDLVFSDLVQPIRIQRSADMNRNYGDVRLTASGWGATWTGGAGPENLNWVFLLGTTNDFCRSTFGGIVQDSTICARGYNDTTQSICQGDSGGPLTVVDEDGKLSVVGVTSFTSGAGCHAGFPGGFIRPGHYHDWYTEVTGINFDWDYEASSSEEDSSPESEEDSSPESEEDSSPETEEDSAPESEEDSNPESEEDSAPESEEDSAPESEEDSSPETEEDSAPESEEDSNPESEEDSAPESEEDSAPESEEDSAPESEEDSAPESEEEPAPESEEDSAPESEEDSAPESEEEPAPESEEDSAPESEEDSAPESEEEPAPESEEDSAPESEEDSAPESEEEPAPESEEEPAPESEEEPAPESEEEPAPESEEDSAPESEEEPAPESEEEPAPESEEEPAPESEEEPAPESEEEPAPESEEEPAPESEEEPAPESEEAPAPESDEEPAPESDEGVISLSNKERENVLRIWRTILNN